MQMLMTQKSIASKLGQSVYKAAKRIGVDFFNSAASFFISKQVPRAIISTKRKNERFIPIVGRKAPTFFSFDD